MIEWWPNMGALSQPWNPLMESPALYLDSQLSVITTSGSDVTQINDISPYARNFTAAVGSRPQTGLATQNGLNVLSFSADMMTSVSAASTWKFMHDSTGASIFAVIAFGATANPDAVYMLCGNNAAGSAAVGTAFYFDDRASLSRNNGFQHLTTIGVTGQPAVTSYIGDNTVTPNAFQIISILSDPGNAVVSQRSRIRINGNTIANNAATTAASAANPTYNLQIGADGSAAVDGRLTGRLASFVIVPGVASQATCERFEGFSADRWGLASNLPAAHPYKYAPPYV